MCWAGVEHERPGLLMAGSSAGNEVSAYVSHVRRHQQISSTNPLPPDLPRPRSAASLYLLQKETSGQKRSRLLPSTLRPSASSVSSMAAASPLPSINSALRSSPKISSSSAPAGAFPSYRRERLGPSSLSFPSPITLRTRPLISACAASVMEEATERRDSRVSTVVDVDLGSRSYPIYIGSGLLDVPDLLQR